MTREEVKQLLPILVAFAEGKVIECRTKPSALRKGWRDINDWVEIEDIAYWSNVEYRIKPEPKYRPFTNAKECWQEMLKHQPFGWVKAISNKEYKAKYYPNSKDDTTLYYQVQKVAPGYIKYDDINDYCEIKEQDKSYEDVFKVITFADGTPFGILEEE